MGKVQEKLTLSSKASVIARPTTCEGCAIEPFIAYEKFGCMGCFFYEEPNMLLKCPTHLDTMSCGFAYANRRGITTNDDHERLIYKEVKNA